VSYVALAADGDEDAGAEDGGDGEAGVAERLGERELVGDGDAAVGR
jgi:hypothetical protein